MKPGQRLNKADVEAIATLALNWCELKYGDSFNNEPVCLCVEYQELKKPIEYGIYDFKNNIIIIFYNTARTPRLICKTIIHEYTHAQQDMNKYTEHHEQYRYHNNPYEKAAYDREDDWRECFNNIIKLKNGTKADSSHTNRADRQET